MTVTGAGDLATIVLTADAVVRNMQSNTAAFEGWAIALRHWCKVAVRLTWTPPADSRNKHYQRFLYRVAQFRTLFPEWFTVADEGHLLKSLVTQVSAGRPRLVLNIAGKRSDEGQSPTTEKPRGPEHELEMRLLGDGNLDRHYRFSDNAEKARQFPVGLFEESVNRASAIFTGGKSAIDLVALDGAKLWLFELKASRNISVGTLSELFFYVSVMRDAVGGRFEFPPASDDASKVTLDRVRNAKEIIGVMLGHNLHPLLASAELLGDLNSAAAAKWDGPSVLFRAGKIEADDPLKIENVV